MKSAAPIVSPVPRHPAIGANIIPSELWPASYWQLTFARQNIDSHLLRWVGCDAISKPKLAFPRHCRTLIRQPFLGKGVASIYPANAPSIGRRARSRSHATSERKAANRVPFMCDECISNSAATPPRCASCAQPMKLVRRTPRFGGLPELITFECRACGVSHFQSS
jgi:hypothetical protein